MLMVAIGYRALKTRYDTPWRLSREIDLSTDSSMTRLQIIELDAAMKQDGQMLYSEEEFFETNKACILRYVRLYTGTVAYNEWRYAQNLSAHVNSLMADDPSLVEQYEITKWINLFTT